MEGRPLEKDIEIEPANEQKLIARSRDGDTNAFGTLVAMHQEIALRVAHVVVRDHAEAEDVAQDAFIKAFAALDRFRAGSPFRPWLLRIVRNEAINRIRRRRRQERLALRVASEAVVASGDAASSPEAAAVLADEIRPVFRALDAISVRHRSVLIHRFVLGLSEEETATVLAIPRGTVKSRTARALAALRTELEGETDG